MGARERFIFETDFPKENRRNDFLPRLWAIRKIGYLLDEIRLHGEDRELKETVITLAKRYHVVTPYTSFLVTEPSRITLGDDRFRPKFDLKREVGRRKMKRCRKRSVFRERQAQASAAEAVARSLQAHEMRDAGTAALARAAPTDVVADPVAHVGNRTFVQVDEKWVDTAYDDKVETAKVELYTREYFNLIRNNPDLAKCFALGERVIVVVNGTAYETIPAPVIDTN